jgi:hypothetical protein
MMPVLAWRKTNALEVKFKQGKYREGTQRYVVVSELRRLERAETLESLTETLTAAPYKTTVKRKDKKGEPLKDSWFVQQAGGIRGSILYHLNALVKDGAVSVSVK